MGALIEKKEIEPDGEPARGTLWLKGGVNKDGEYPDDEIRSMGDKLKETEDKIKEGTLKGMIMGTNSMTFCIGKEKGGGLRVDSNPINSSGSFSADEEGGTPIFGCENDASIQKSNGLATLEKEMETRVIEQPMVRRVLHDESTESDDDKSDDLNKTNDEEEDDFVCTPDDYVPTDDENVDDEEYKHINKMYDDVIVVLKDAKPANEEEDDEEMTHAENVNAEHEEVSQEVAGDQVKDDA
ncbi:hypothetical protein Tco_0888954 [Tanacetum coccineum]